MSSLPIRRSCDNTVDNCFIQISFYLRAYVRIRYEKTKGQIPLRPSLGKQNIQAKEVYCRKFIRDMLFLRGRALVCAVFSLMHASQCPTFLYFPCLQISWSHGILVSDNWLISSKHWALAESPHVRESKTALDSGIHVVDSGFQVLDSGLFVSGIWISDSNC